MRKTLYLKFLLAYLIFGLFGFILVATFISTMTEGRVRHDKAEAMYKTAIDIADSFASDLYKNKTSLDVAKTQMDNLSVYLDGVIWIINPSGRIILDSSKPMNVNEEIVIQGFDPTIVGNSYYTEGKFFDAFESEQLSVIAPITNNYKISGYVAIHYEKEKLLQAVYNYLNISYILLVVLFLLSLIILIFFSEIVYNPIKKITYATEQFAQGNMHYKVSVDSGDELGYLAASLSYMAEKVANSEDNQKKFIANVSHDFRSPLTSIKGYLEAMLDGTIPPEMHEKYLGIVLNETLRLTKLTNGLLQLNNLNTEGMVLQKTEFDINTVIRNTCASFEGTCSRKNITLDLILTGEELLVEADADRIQQVLYNLIDNAIKFSHNDSVIKIETNERKNKLFVSVKDSGIGIPKESLKKIFERFYKTDLSRGKDKKGTGLGLSIVKEIIQAHNENINVISTEGVGTEFIFSLPVVDTDED